MLCILKTRTIASVGFLYGYKDRAKEEGRQKDSDKTNPHSDDFVTVRKPDNQILISLQKTKLLPGSHKPVARYTCCMNHEMEHNFQCSLNK